MNIDNIIPIHVSDGEYIRTTTISGNKKTHSPHLNVEQWAHEPNVISCSRFCKKIINNSVDHWMDTPNQNKGLGLKQIVQFD